MARQDNTKAFSCENLSFAAKEAYKKLRVNLMISLSEEDKGHIIGITSAQPSEGKSTTALNIAYTIAESGKKVLLVDGDMRRPSLHDKLAIELAPGLANLLTDTNNVSSVIRKYQDGSSEVPLDIITGGDIPGNPSELLNGKRMAKLLTALREAYDFIVLDLPPVGAVIDAVSVAKNTDGMLVIIRENNCPKHMLVNCVEQLKFAKINILGFVINGSTEAAGKKYSYSKYGYGNYGYYK